DVERARLEERSVVRTWAMRGTLHLVATEDLGWLLPVLGPVFIAANRRRRAELGLDEATSARGVRMLQQVLAEDGPLTRAEIVERLGARGIRLEGQAAPHLLGYAALQSVICLGPDRGSKPTYVLLSDWADRGDAKPRQAALGSLARRYVGAYGPAGPDDLVAWSGLPAGEARAAWKSIADELLEVEASGRPAWMLKTRTAWLDDLSWPAARTPLVRLLPSFDTYLLGYRGRDLIVAPPYAKRIHPGGGILHPTLLVDGRAAGTWRSARRRGSLEVVVEPFDALPPDVHAGLDAEVADMGRFLGIATTWSLAAPGKER
ncbi:MAG: winged helix DNA-binding domain-containing protein, partial [Chloroflexota bacterium]